MVREERGGKSGAESPFKPEKMVAWNRCMMARVEGRKRAKAQIGLCSRIDRI